MYLNTNSNLNMNLTETPQQEEQKMDILNLSKVQSEKINLYMKSTDTTDLIMNYYSKQLVKKTCNGF